MNNSNTSGHKVYLDDGKYFYTDTKEPVTDNPRPCFKCGKGETSEGHDPCIGTLPDIRNACCGHGIESDAYIQFSDSSVLDGKLAIMVIDNMIARNML